MKPNYTGRNESGARCAATVAMLCPCLTDSAGRAQVPIYSIGMQKLFSTQFWRYCVKPRRVRWP